MSRWNSVGPSVVKQGQGGVKPDTSGRTTGIAVTRGGSTIYVATANGGVWRSDNTGQSWHSLMDAFDLNPQHVASDSLACGAIAIDLDNPDLVYVGTGDGPGSGNGSGYTGVGPIISTDGGNNWTTEPTAPGNPPLSGSVFYALAIDPVDPNRVVAATKEGLYRREPNGSGGFHWTRKHFAIHRPSTSVVVTNKNNITTFFGAHRNSKVFSSTDGNSWNELGTGFPTDRIGQIRLAVQPNNPDMVYALIATPAGSFRGVWRWNRTDDTWRAISGIPSDLFGSAGRYQGWYDIAIAVDPNNDRIIYLGGSTKYSNREWSGSVYRSTVSGSRLSYIMSNVYIGNSVHADIHNLVFTPGDSDKLWLGCDGGVFYSTNPKSPSTTNLFSSRNNGLSTLMMEHIGLHPTDKNILFCGTQDNGGLKYSGSSEWIYSSPGDAGFQIINWNDTSKILSSYVENIIRVSTSGGTRKSYTEAKVPISTEPVLWYAPVVGTPPNPTNPVESNTIAFGSIRPWISTDFGNSWISIPQNSRPNDALNSVIRSLVFASATKLYAGTWNGGIYRFDNTGSGWTRTQIDTMGGVNDFPLDAVVTDIAIDPSDSTGNSIYVSLGGHGDYRHVWHFDGTEWQSRSGPQNNPSQRLLDVQASAIIVDPNNPDTVYVGMDIGCWRSTDSGMTWDVFSEGLPDSAVMDLKIHPSEFLFASTHGRGVFERDITQSPTTTPDNPTGLSSTAVSSTQIDLTWISPSNDGGSPITGYKLQKRTGSSTWTNLFPGNVISYSDTGLSPNTAYEYQVAAINSVGVSDVSGITSSTTLPPPPLDVLYAPTNFKATSVSTSQINLSWNPPTNTGGSPITNYTIKRKASGSSTWISLSSLSETTTSYTDQSLRKGTAYTYEIIAMTATDTSSPAYAYVTTKNCFILTAAYGSELETRAYFVHEFINKYLLESKFEKPSLYLLKQYYRFSPPIANLMERNKPFKYFMKYTVAIPFLALARTTAILVKPFIK